jgi:hypothetical protein
MYAIPDCHNDASVLLGGEFDPHGKHLFFEEITQKKRVFAEGKR